ncbi:hypothetical protein LOD99_7863 [Oopsacas minuta]|uniref:Uncharacterized protein n=1 Tax=Oopsacas minuta TaxID=111878 RepID=A0AAV7JPQ8_9METZ|nr:hypothetical protein LOD99_7863 [Oopsacas minuta]
MHSAAEYTGESQGQPFQIPAKIHPSFPVRIFGSKTKRDPAFISKGYTNWEDATTAFSTRLAIRYHKEAVDTLEFQSKPVMLAKIKRSIRQKTKRCSGNSSEFSVFCPTRLVTEGHGDSADSNFIQLLRLRAFDSPAVLSWMRKKTDKTG